MAYAFVEDGSIAEVHFLLPVNWRNISNFDTLTPTDLNNLGWSEIIDVVPDYDSDTQEVYDTTLVIDNGAVKRLFLIRPKEVVIESTPPE